MNNPSDLLLNVWQEACRHIHIQESISAIGDTLVQRMSLDGVLICTLDLEKATAETLAGAFRDEHTKPGDLSKSEIIQPHIEKLNEWLQSGEIVHIKPGTEPPPYIKHLIPQELHGNLMLAPLYTDHSPHGVFIIYTNKERPLLLEHKNILKELIEPIKTALNNHQRLGEIKKLKEAAEADRDSLFSRLGRSEIGDVVIGANKGLKYVMERVRLVSHSDMPVLILGETGAGKEVVARAIHQQSSRSHAPFIRVNCGAIPGELIDSELFGHERGSFTGATETRKGWFERADGGTLFLDEVGELPHAAQVRLLRVLQDGTFERVGGGKSLHVDVRIVAATHRNLPDMVSEKKFREDLWYRIAVFPVDLPPLRDRRDDIPDLARHFALKASQRFGVPLKALSDHGMSLLLNYDWPGNVRELSTVIERATILSKELELDIETALGIQPKSKKPFHNKTHYSEPDSFPSLDLAMKMHIEKALNISKGRVEGPFGAAELLDINPHTLRGRMRKLGIIWQDYRPDN
jgi:hydrogenase-4 transcriptional activator